MIPYVSVEPGTLGVFKAAFGYETYSSPVYDKHDVFVGIVDYALGMLMRWAHNDVLPHMTPVT